MQVICQLNNAAFPIWWALQNIKLSTNRSNICQRPGWFWISLWKKEKSVLLSVCFYGLLLFKPQILFLLNYNHSCISWKIIQKQKFCVYYVVYVYSCVQFREVEGGWCVSAVKSLLTNQALKPLVPALCLVVVVTYSLADKLQNFVASIFFPQYHYPYAVALSFAQVSTSSPAWYYGQFSLWAKTSNWKYNSMLSSHIL